MVSRYITRFLIEIGVAVSARDCEGWTPPSQPRRHMPGNSLSSALINNASFSDNFSSVDALATVDHYKWANRTTVDTSDLDSGQPRSTIMTWTVGKNEESDAHRHRHTRELGCPSHIRWSLSQRARNNYNKDHATVTRPDAETMGKHSIRFHRATRFCSVF